MTQSLKLRSKIIASITIAMFGLGLVAKPSDAATTSCWFGERNQRLEQFNCSVVKRINANGHIVWDVGDNQNEKVFTFVIWGDKQTSNGEADFIYQGKSIRVYWHQDRDGDIRLTSRNGSQMAIRMPRRPASSPRSGNTVVPAGGIYGDMFQQ